MRVFGASADARTVVIWGTGRWTADDHDNHFTFDVYRLRNGVEERLSKGPTGGNADSFDAEPTGLSEDGAVVLFETAENLTADDTDYKTTDVYRWAGGTVTRLSRGSAAEGNTDGHHAAVAGHSRDARVVLLSTIEPLTPDDRDGQLDIFARVGGATVKVSPGDGPYPAHFDDVSDDGAVVLLNTQERLTADDQDSRADLHRVAGAQVTRVSTGPKGGNSDHYPVGDEPDRIDGQAIALSRDGARAVFTSTEQLTHDDTDGQLDTDRWGAGGVVRVSTGPNGGNGEYGPGGWNLSGFGLGGAADGSTVVFTSRERITADDTDDHADLFEWTASGTRRVTTGPLGGNAPVDVVCPPIVDPCGRLSFVSTDGRRIVSSRPRSASFPRTRTTSATSICAPAGSPRC